MYPKHRCNPIYVEEEILVLAQLITWPNVWELIPLFWFLEKVQIYH